MRHPAVIGFACLLAFGRPAFGQQPAANPEHVMKRHKFPVTRIAFHPSDADSFASASAGGEVLLWRFKKDGWVDEGLTKYNEEIWGLGYAPKNKAHKLPEMVAVVNDNWWGSEVRVIDPLIGKLPFATRIRLNGFKFGGGAAACLSVSQDGQLMAVGVRDHTVRVWSLSTPVQQFNMGVAVQLVEDSVAARAPVHGIAIGPVDKQTGVAHLAVGCNQGTIELYNVTSPDPKKKRGFKIAPSNIRIQGHNGLVPRLAINPIDQDELASCAHDGTVRIWNLRTGAQLHVIQGKHKIINDITYSPNGNHVVIADDSGSVTVWSKRVARDVVVLQHSQQHGVKGVAISHNGMKIATGGADFSVKIWKAP